ncbi:4'-phosphopantetheinyl transferase family protein [Psychromonas aquimarina]|uniref:4'-phosphopantetheinyl transferase family protein n=1 Tax=Psychromonas aquimarina TaxID=444919 RepID=UPI0004005BCF|nr:4'-phosphopantetheinyl transferase superfamily protein [Psychromonas aquimarina]
MPFNSPSANKTLLSGDIHLWRIQPQKITDLTVLKSLKSVLTQSEIEKVQRYRSPKAQHNALITRAFVRFVLSQYAEIKPQDWSFTISEHGKPELNNTTPALRFNLSHNDDLLVCSVCLGHDIGCDVENLSRRISVEAIAKRYFSAEEYQSLKDLAPALQRRRFFEYWTLKEAFVKATGLGISQGLDTFSFKITAPETGKLNSNISLSFSQKSPIKNEKDWYSCLTYPDQKHCVAVCINSGSKSKQFQLTHFQGEDCLPEFQVGRSSRINPAG